jgi:translation elongation factor EF-Ts
MGDSNKPTEVLDKIVNGRMQKFYKDVCLKEQEHMVAEGNSRVDTELQKQGLTVNAFWILSV